MALGLSFLLCHSWLSLRGDFAVTLDQSQHSWLPSPVMSSSWGALNISHYLHSSKKLTTGWQTFWNGPNRNILGSVGHLVSITTFQLCCHSWRVDLDIENISANQHAEQSHGTLLMGTEIWIPCNFHNSKYFSFDFFNCFKYQVVLSSLATQKQRAARFGPLAIVCTNMLNSSWKRVGVGRRQSRKCQDSASHYTAVTPAKSVYQK